MEETSGNRPSVRAVIVNFNAGEALCRCVASLLDQDVPLRITVVDNASSDGSPDLLEQRFAGAPQLRLIRNDGNRGFATAVNQGAVNQGAANQTTEETAGGASADYLLVLNPDCEMLPGSLRALRAALDADPAAALAGPLVVDGEGRALRGTLRRFPDPRKSFMTLTGLSRLGRRNPAFAGVEQSHDLPSGTRAAEAVSGACMLIRSEVFHAIGRMDTAYGMHCEDLDLMYRMKLQGHHCLIVPAARVFHQQGLSSRSRPLWVHWQKHRGMQRFFRKFQSGNHVFPVRWLVFAGIWLRFAATLPLALLRR